MNPILLHGTAQPRPVRCHLHAGPLSVLYENGFLRYVKLGGEEVLRMIYFALRDENWATMEPRISDERIETEDRSFHIRYVCGHYQGDTEIIRWQCAITGEESGTITFTIDGEVLASFRRNRAGFCVLHPVDEVVGQLVVISHPDGNQTEGVFPRLISPHQPFLDIAAMRWTLPSGAEAAITFEGDVFEMEDHRNWTDTSFKTYCTPLYLPKPVQLQPSDRIRQTVTLELTRIPQNLSETLQTSGSQPVTLHPLPSAHYGLPAIGLSQAIDQPKLKTDEVEQLRHVAPDHLRIEVDFRRADWSEWLTVGLSEAKKLPAKVLLAVLFTENHAVELSQFGQAMEWLGVQPWAVEVFSTVHRATPDALVQAVVGPLRQQFPDALIGAGSHIHFTDLNRNRFDARALDYVVYSVNPQIHAFDDLSIIENIHAQADTVASARAFVSDRPIHVGPISLRPRFNPEAVGEQIQPDDQLPYDTDPRQPSLLAAGWLLGSLAALSGTGVARVTYFETKGQTGVIQGMDAPTHPDLFYAEPGQVFPVGLLLRALTDWKSDECLPIRVSNPLAVSALWLRQGDRQLLLLANHTWDDQTVELPADLALFREMWLLDETTAPEAMRTGTLPLRQSFAGKRVVLKPFALVGLS